MSDFNPLTHPPILWFVIVLSLFLEVVLAYIFNSRPAIWKVVFRLCVVSLDSWLLYTLDQLWLSGFLIGWFVAYTIFFDFYRMATEPFE